MDLFKDIVDQYLAYDDSIKKTRVCIHGYGDVLTNPRLFEYLDYLQEKRFSMVDFSDNGMLFTEEIVRKLCTYSIFAFIKISLNSSRKEVMEAINTGADFDTVVANAKMLCDIVKEYDYPFQVWIQLMKTSRNLDETTADTRRLIGRTENIKYNECPINNQLNFNPTNDLLMPEWKLWSGKCVFSENNRMVHWDGDLVGCCVDNTKTQVYGNARDGIYSDKVEAKRQQWENEMVKGNYSNLPACAMCSAKDNNVN